MSVERERVRALVREELRARLSPPDRSHPALVEIVIETACSEDMDHPVRRACVIEPDRPCYNSGYCRQRGY